MGRAPASADELNAIEAAAIRWLAVREHSVRELSCKLGRRYADSSLVEQVIEDLLDPRRDAALGDQLLGNLAEADDLVDLGGADVGGLHAGLAVRGDGGRDRRRRATPAAQGRRA